MKCSLYSVVVEAEKFSEHLSDHYTEERFDSCGARVLLDSSNTLCPAIIGPYWLHMSAHQKSHTISMAGATSAALAVSTASTSVSIPVAISDSTQPRQCTWRRQKSAQEDEERVARGEPPRKRLAMDIYHYICKQCGLAKNKTTSHIQLKGRWYCPASGVSVAQ